MRKAICTHFIEAIGMDVYRIQRDERSFACAGICMPQPGEINVLRRIHDSGEKSWRNMMMKGAR